MHRIDIAPMLLQILDYQSTVTMFGRWFTTQ